MARDTPAAPPDRPNLVEGRPTPWVQHCLQQLDSAGGTLRLASGVGDPMHVARAIDGLRGDAGGDAVRRAA